MTPIFLDVAHVAVNESEFSLTGENTFGLMYPHPVAWVSFFLININA